MIGSILQILTTGFSFYVLIPVLVPTLTLDVLKFVFLMPFGLCSLVFALSISALKLLTSTLTARKGKFIYNLFFLLINLTLGIMLLIKI